MIAVAVKRAGLRRVQARLQRTFTSSRARLSRDETLEAARRTAWAIGVVAQRGLWPANCLQRSLALWWFLGRRGIPSDLRIGVRRRPRTEGDRALDFEFHAWVEHTGVVVNDAPNVRALYATFDQVIAPEDARWS